MPKTTSLDLRELAEPFNAWCSQRKVSRSLAIRQLVNAAIRNDEQLSWLAPPDLTSLSGEWDGLAHTGADPRYCFTLRLTQSQRDHLRVRAAAAGISCTRYILAAITARDSDAQTVAGEDAVKALVRSNDLLAMTALKLSVWRGGGASNATELVNELQSVVREHLAHTAAIAAQVEGTRIGRAPQGRARKRAIDGRPGGTR